MIIKKMYVFLLVMIFSVGFVWGQNTQQSGQVLSSQQLVEQSFETLVQKKDELINRLTINENALIQRIDTFQSFSGNSMWKLVECLGITSFSNILSLSSGELQTLRSMILSDFVSLQTQIQNLQSRNALGIVNGLQFDVEAQNILISVDQYKVKFDRLIDQYRQKYDLQIGQAIVQAQTVMDKNKSLFDRLSTSYQNLISLMKSFDRLEQQILVLNAFYLGDGYADSKVFQQSQQVALNDLNQRNRKFVNELMKVQGHIIGLQEHVDILLSQSNDAYAQQYQQFFAELLGASYDVKEFSLLKGEIDILKKRFFDGSGLMCGRILDESFVVDRSFMRLQERVDQLSKIVSANINDRKDMTVNNNQEQYIEQKLQNFHALAVMAQSQSFVASVQQFLTEQHRKLSLQQQRFDALMTEHQTLQNLSGRALQGKEQEKYDREQRLISELVELYHNVLSDHLKKNIEQIVGLYNATDLLKPIVNTYGFINLEKRLLNWLVVMAQQYDSSESFNNALDQLMVRLDRQLANNLTPKTRYIFSTLRSVIIDYQKNLSL